VYALATVGNGTLGVITFNTAAGARTATLVNTADCLAPGIGIAGVVSADGRYWATVSTVMNDDVLLVYNASNIGSECTAVAMTGIQAVSAHLVIPSSGLPWALDTAAGFVRFNASTLIASTLTLNTTSCALILQNTPSTVKETWRTTTGNVGFMQETNPPALGTVDATGHCTVVDMTTLSVTKALHAAPDGVGCTLLVFENAASAQRLGRLCGTEFHVSTNSVMPASFDFNMARATDAVFFGPSATSLARLDIACVAPVTTTAVVATTTVVAATATTTAAVAATTTAAVATTTVSATTTAAPLVNAPVPTATLDVTLTKSLDKFGTSHVGAVVVPSVQLAFAPLLHPDTSKSSTFTELTAPHRKEAGAVWIVTAHTNKVAGDWILSVLKTAGISSTDSYPLVGTGMLAIATVTSDDTDTDRVTLSGLSATGTVRILSGRPAVSPLWVHGELADRHDAAHSAVVTRANQLVLAFPVASTPPPSGAVTGGVSHVSLVSTGTLLPSLPIATLAASHRGLGVAVTKLFSPVTSSSLTLGMVNAPNVDSLQTIVYANGTGVTGNFPLFVASSRRLLQASSINICGVGDTKVIKASNGLTWLATQGTATHLPVLSTRNFASEDVATCTPRKTLAHAESWLIIWQSADNFTVIAAVANSTVCNNPAQVLLVDFLKNGTVIAPPAKPKTKCTTIAGLPVLASGNKLVILFTSLDKAGGLKVWLIVLISIGVAAAIAFLLGCQYASTGGKILWMWDLKAFLNPGSRRRNMQYRPLPQHLGRP
jgi:hypothetical protein